MNRREFQTKSGPELSDLIFRERKIEAINLYRKLAGFGLKEAKDEVDAIELTLQKDFPGKFAASPKWKGCLGAVALICLLVIVGACWIALR